MRQECITIDGLGVRSRLADDEVTGAWCGEHVAGIGSAKFFYQSRDFANCRALSTPSSASEHAVLSAPSKNCDALHTVAPITSTPCMVSPAVRQSACDATSSAEESGLGAAAMYSKPCVPPTQYVSKSDLAQAKTELLVSVKALLADLVGQHLQPAVDAAKGRAKTTREPERLTRDALERLAWVEEASDCFDSGFNTYPTTTASCSTAASLQYSSASLQYSSASLQYSSASRAQHPRPPRAQRHHRGGSRSGGGAPDWTATPISNTSCASSRRSSLTATDATWTATTFSDSGASRPASDARVPQLQPYSRTAVAAAPVPPPSRSRPSAAAAAAVAAAPSPLRRASLRHDADCIAVHDDNNGGDDVDGNMGAAVKAAAAASTTDAADATDDITAASSFPMPVLPVLKKSSGGGGVLSSGGGGGRVSGRDSGGGAAQDTPWSGGSLSSPSTPMPFRRLRVSSEVLVAAASEQRRSTWDCALRDSQPGHPGDGSLAAAAAAAGMLSPQAESRYRDAGDEGSTVRGTHGGGDSSARGARGHLGSELSDSGDDCTAGTWQYVCGDLSASPFPSSRASIASHMLHHHHHHYDAGSSDSGRSGASSVRSASLGVRSSRMGYKPANQRHHRLLRGGSSGGSSLCSTAAALVPRELLDATASEALRLTGLVSRLQRQLCEAQAELAGRDAVVQLLHGRLDELATVASVASPA